MVKITIKELKDKLFELIAGLDMASMAEDVSSFLIKPDDKERVLRFKQYIEQMKF